MAAENCDGMGLPKQLHSGWCCDAANGKPEGVTGSRTKNFQLQPNELEHSVIFHRQKIT